MASDDLSGIAEALHIGACTLRKHHAFECRENTEQIEAALRLQREAGRHEGDLALTHHAAEETQKRLSAEADVLRLRTALQTLVIDANRLCDRRMGGTYEEDCRRSIIAAREALRVHD
jgi:hypothetical protein